MSLRHPSSSLAGFVCEVVCDRAAAHVRVAGELDLVSVPELDRQLQELRDAGCTALVLDLRDVSFMDSTGIRLLWCWTQSARTDGPEFSIVPGAAVTRLVELCGMLDVLTLADVEFSPG